MKKTKLLTGTLSISAGISIALPLSLSSCSCGGSEPIIHNDNNVTFVGEKERILTTERVINLKFKLDHPLQGENTVSCEATSINGTNTLSVSVAEYASIGQDQTEFTLDVSIAKTNGGEPYNNDLVSFDLTFTGRKGETQTFQSKIEGFKFKYEIDDSNIIPFDLLNIENGVLNGLTCPWTDARIKAYDTLYIPNSVVEINKSFTGYDMTTSASNIKTLKFEEGNNPLYISNGSLGNIKKIETLILPKRLAYIGQQGFRFCDSLKVVDISSWDEEKFDVNNPFGESYIFDSINSTAGTFRLFDSTVALDAHYTFSTLNTSFANWSGITKNDIGWVKSDTKDNFNFDLFNDGKQVITGINGSFSGTMTIPNWCDAIKPKAFVNSSSATTISGVNNITFAENSKIEKIYAFAFYKAGPTSGNLNIDFSNATSLKLLDSGAFSESKLNNVVLPESVKGISSNCFSKCSTLASVDLSKTQITKICLGSFYNCKNLQTIELNNSISWIGSSAFDGCSKLNHNFDLANRVSYVGSYAFRNCAYCNFTLPSDDNSPLLYIGDLAFYNANLGGVLTITPKIRYIGDGAFASNNHILMIQSRNPNFRVDNNGYLFNANDELILSIDKTGNFPNDITDIKPYAVAGLELENNKIDLSLMDIRSIGDYAFYQTKCAEGFNITLPEGIEYIGTNAFEGSDISGINWDVLNNKTFTKGMFKGCTKFEEVTIPQTITSIPESAFEQSGIKRLTLSSSVAMIDRYAFKECKFEWIDVSDYASVPTQWANQSFYVAVAVSWPLTIYIKDSSLSSQWDAALDAAWGSSHYSFNCVVKQ